MLCFLYQILMLTCGIVMLYFVVFVWCIYDGFMHNIMHNVACEIGWIKGRCKGAVCSVLLWLPGCGSYGCSIDYYVMWLLILYYVVWCDVFRDVDMLKTMWISLVVMWITFAVCVVMWCSYWYYMLLLCVVIIIVTSNNM